MKILVIEDDREAAEYLERALTEAGHTAHVARDGETGFSLADSGEYDILVIDRQGDDRHACWGAVMTAAAQAAGIVGVVIDGFVTDVTAIRASGLPVWCRGRSPLTTKLLGKGGTIGETVTCGGATVRPGDLVLADENGVCVIDPAQAETLASTCAAMQAAEPGIIQRVLKGERIDEINGARKLFDKLRAS